MPKRKNKDSNSDHYILRKIRKLEKKLKKRNRQKSPSMASILSSDDSKESLSLQADNQTEESVDSTHVRDNTHNGVNTVDLNLTEMQEQDYIPHILESEQHNTDSVISDLPSNSAEVTEPSTVLDENILELLGETPSKKKNYSTPIQTELAIRWEHIVATGLTKTMKKDLLDKYFLPENCLKIGAPKLNPEIKAALSDTLVKKDSAIETKQNQRAVAISCISQALTKIFASENKDADVIKLLIDACRLMCDSQYIESMSRRSFVTSTIKKDIKDQLYTTEIDSFLFGEKLADTLKAAKAINKSGAEMKTVHQPKPANLSQPRFNQSRPLNLRPPLPQTRQTAAGRRATTAAMQQPRRYQGPPPQPPPPQLAIGHHSSLHTPLQRSRGRMQTRR